MHVWNYIIQYDCDEGAEEEIKGIAAMHVLASNFEHKAQSHVSMKKRKMIGFSKRATEECERNCSGDRDKK